MLIQHKILCLTISMKLEAGESTIYPTLLWDKEDIILVGCGFIVSQRILENELQQHGLSTAQLTGLILTHHDQDHMGAAAALKKLNPKMKIYSSSLEAPFISAEEKALRLTQAEEMQKTLPPEQQDFGKAFCNMSHQVELVVVDYLLEDNDYLDWCGGCRIIATPGHTPGHISLFIKNDSIITPATPSPWRIICPLLQTLNLHRKGDTVFCVEGEYHQRQKGMRFP